jgi:phosphoribosyl-ATP pyrophosphohydrolase
LRVASQDKTGLYNMSEHDTLARLAAVIASRRQGDGNKSYTRQLLDAGPERCAKKFGEEAVETVIAGVGKDVEHIKAEAADTLYHLLVLLEAHRIALADVMAILEGRMGTSGLEEKAARMRTGP